MPAEGRNNKLHEPPHRTTPEQNLYGPRFFRCRWSYVVGFSKRRLVCARSPGFTLDGRFRTNPDDPYGTPARQYGRSPRKQGPDGPRPMSRHGFGVRTNKAPRRGRCGAAGHPPSLPPTWQIFASRGPPSNNKARTIRGMVRFTTAFAEKRPIKQVATEATNYAIFASRGPPSSACWRLCSSLWGRFRPGRGATGSSSTELTRTYIRRLKYKLYFWSVFGRCSAKVRPGTVTNGPGLKHAA